MTTGIHGWTLCKQPHVLLTPDWRYELAQRPEEEWEADGVAEDGALRAVAEVIRRAADKDAGEPIQATPEVLSIKGAMEIATAKEIAERVKALAIGRCPAEEIAAFFALDADAVEAFLLIFWDLRGFLDAPGRIYILLEKSKGLDLAVWGRVAFGHGPEMLKALWGITPMTPEMHEAVEEHVRTQVSKHVCLAAFFAGIGKGPGSDIMRQFLAMRRYDLEKGRAKALASQGNGSGGSEAWRKPVNMRTDALKRFAFPEGGPLKRS